MSRRLYLNLWNWESIADIRVFCVLLSKVWTIVMQVKTSSSNWIPPLEYDWLILQFYVPLKIFSLIWRRHHCRWRAAKFRPMLCAQGLWAGRDIYRATPAVTQDLGFSGLIRRTAPFSRLLRHMRGCDGSILTRILTAPFRIRIYENMKNSQF
jgi:hypothetical protein